jgi:hypothetical protein
VRENLLGRENCQNFSFQTVKIVCPTLFLFKAPNPSEKTPNKFYQTQLSNNGISKKAVAIIHFSLFRSILFQLKNPETTE